MRIIQGERVGRSPAKAGSFYLSGSDRNCCRIWACRNVKLTQFSIKSHIATRPESCFF